MQTRVVIADDHQIVSEGLGALIRQQADMELVAEVENGREAIAITQKLKPDIVIMDISMPEVNGIAATRRIVGAGLPCKVIIMSMHADRKYIIEAFRAGASGYLLKNSNFAELLDAIRTVQEGRCYLSRDCTGIVVTDIVRDGVMAPSSLLAKLTDRELEVLKKAVEGLAAKEIANELGLGLKTVETHLRRLKDKLGIYNLVELTKLAIREGLTSVEPRLPK